MPNSNVLSDRFSFRNLPENDGVRHGLPSFDRILRHAWCHRCLAVFQFYPQSMSVYLAAIKDSI